MVDIYGYPSYYGINTLYDLPKYDIEICTNVFQFAYDKY